MSRASLIRHTSAYAHHTASQRHMRRRHDTLQLSPLSHPVYSRLLRFSSSCSWWLHWRQRFGKAPWAVIWSCSFDQGSWQEWWWQDWLPGILWHAEEPAPVGCIPESQIPCLFWQAFLFVPFSTNTATSHVSLAWIWFALNLYYSGCS